MGQESHLPPFVQKFIQEYGETSDGDRERFQRRQMATNEYGQAFQEMMDGFDAKLSPERQEVYEAIENRVGGTPLVEIVGMLPNGNRLFVKEEFRNELGNSHYDRVYLALFKEKERLGIIKPGDNVFETTSGTAGVSFGAIGEVLGYHTHVAIPDGGEKAREKAIEDTGAILHHTPAELYVVGFNAFIKEFMRIHPDYVFINHSMGNVLGRGSDVNEMAIQSMYCIADEILVQLQSQGLDPDIILSALGNGTNTLGIGRYIDKKQVKAGVVAYETLTSGVGYAIKYGEQAYKRLLDTSERFNATDFARHSMPGTSYPGIDFPALRSSIGYVSSVVLVADSRVEAVYKKTTGNIELPEGVVRVERFDGLDVYGRSTLAGLSIAKNLSETVSDKIIVAMGYDTSDRYDSNSV